jgi:hypothetical protein
MMAIELSPLPPGEAKQAYLSRFRELSGEAPAAGGRRSGVS